MYIIDCKMDMYIYIYICENIYSMFVFSRISTYIYIYISICVFLSISSLCRYEHWQSMRSGGWHPLAIRGCGSQDQPLVAHGPESEAICFQLFT